MQLRVTEKLFMETFSSVVSLIVRDHRCVDFLCCEPEFDVCLEPKETKKIRALMFPSELSPTQTQVSAARPHSSVEFGIPNLFP